MPPACGWPPPPASLRACPLRKPPTPPEAPARPAHRARAGHRARARAARRPPLRLAGRGGARRARPRPPTTGCGAWSTAWRRPGSPSLMVFASVWGAPRRLAILAAVAVVGFLLRRWRRGAMLVVVTLLGASAARRRAQAALRPHPPDRVLRALPQSRAPSASPAATRSSPPRSSAGSRCCCGAGWCTALRLGVVALRRRPDPADRVLPHLSRRALPERRARAASRRASSGSAPWPSATGSRRHGGGVPAFD